MEENILQDALRLASNILKSLLPNEKLVVENIAIDKRDVFSLEKYPSIPQSFGYKYDKTPILLEWHGVIDGKTDGWWFVRATGRKSYWSSVMPQELSEDDKISETARKKRYIRQDEIIEYYYHVPTEDIGPRKHGQAAVLINRQKLEDFVNYLKGLKPRFSLETGIFEFIGQSVTIDGKIERKSFELLLDNLNSIVSKKEFYEVRDKNDYDTIYRQTGITKLHDALEKVFSKLRERVESNPKLKQAIKFIQKDGFGMFINEKALIKSSKS